MESSSIVTAAQQRRTNFRLLGRTMAGPIYAAQTSIVVAPPKVAFAMLRELAVRSVDPNAEVRGTIAKQYRGEAALSAHSVFTGLAAGSLFVSPLGVQRGIFETLKAYVLSTNDATGVESLYLTAWQSIWMTLQPAEQRRAADIWNGLVRQGRLARAHGVIGIDRATLTAVGIDPESLQKVGEVDLKIDPWEKVGMPGADLRPGRGSGLVSSQRGLNSQPDSGMGIDPHSGKVNIDHGEGGVTINPRTGQVSFDSGTSGVHIDIGSGRVTFTPGGGDRDFAIPGVGSDGSGLFGGDVMGPLGKIINGINSRTDREGDAGRRSAAAGTGQSVGGIISGIGVVLLGIGLAPGFQAALIPGAALVGLGAGIGLVSSVEKGAADSETASAQEAKREKEQKEKDQKEKEEKEKKGETKDEKKDEKKDDKKDGGKPNPEEKPNPFDRPNPFDNLLRVASFTPHSDDFYPDPDDPDGGGGPRAVGLREVAAEVICGPGLDAYLLITEEGHVRMPGLASLIR